MRFDIIRINLNNHLRKKIMQNRDCYQEREVSRCIKLHFMITIVVRSAMEQSVFYGGHRGFSKEMV